MKKYKDTINGQCYQTNCPHCHNDIILKRPTKICIVCGGELELDKQK